MSAISFLRGGFTNPEIGKWKYAHYTCSVTLSEPPPAVDKAEALITTTLNNSLADRVKPVPGEPNRNIVDQFFLIEHATGVPRTDAVRLWSNLTSYTQRVMIGSGIGGLSLTFLAVYGAPFYIEVVLLAGIIAACCLFGGSLQRYYIAEKEHKLWIHPGEEFALRRKAALELPLDKISEQKCHYHPEQLSGTLLGIEIFYLFKKSFQQFAEPLIARTCDTPSLQHQWVIDFFSSNPLMIEFLKDNPHLEKEEEWKVVKPFHLITIKLWKHLEDLQKQYHDQFPKDLEAVRKKLEELESKMDQAISKAFTNLALDPTIKERYQRNLVFALNEEYISKIYVLAQKHQTQRSHFCSFVYPQVRKLLELAHTRLVKQELCEIEMDDLDKKPHFIEEYQEILKLYPQQVIVRAKSLDTDATYQNFIDEVFKS